MPNCSTSWVPYCSTNLMREMMGRSLLVANILMMLMCLLVILGATKMVVAAHPGMRQVGFVPGVSRIRSAGGFAAVSPERRRRAVFTSSSSVYLSIGDETGSREFAPHNLLKMMEENSPEPMAVDQQLTDDPEEEACIQRRQFLAATAAAALLGTSLPSNALDAKSLPALAEKANYLQSPINKRSGITLSEPEKIYPLSFITYLSRFLLVFDDACQRWWYTQAQAIPAKSTKEDVENIRLRQFGQFAASVEVGLIEFEGKEGEGVKRLIDSLVQRYGPASLTASYGTPVNATSSAPEVSEREVRKSKEALRQIALLFSLLKEYQPVDAITQLLAADDDAKIVSVEMVDGGAGYPPPAYNTPDVTFPEPPTMGTDFPATVATGKAVMMESGRILKLELTQGGRGYLNPPSVEIDVPLTNGDTDVKRMPAKAVAVLGKKKVKGSVERIDIVDPGTGYSSLDDITVKLSSPESPDGVTATAKAILEYEVTGVNITDGGCGYAAERALNIVIDPPPGAARGSGGSRSAFAVAYPKGKSTSYESFIGKSADSSVIAAAISNVDTSQWVAGPTSSQLLSLLPSGFGLQYDLALERYILSRSTTENSWDDILGGSLEGQTFKAINPIFGFRGRSPIEKEKKLSLDAAVRFMASGAICSSVAHFALTPLDVVKTKVQTKPDVYNSGIAGTFTKVLDEEGAKTFFDGWEPTFVGYFIAGAIAFFLTEYFKRSLTDVAMTVLMAQSSMSEVSAAATASSLEIPIIVASAAASAFFCCFVMAPFDAVRIRTVSQPDYADNIFGVVNRMIEEEGWLSLFSAVPVWFLKEIPYNTFKFLVFDTSTDAMYNAFPAAREDIGLSLLVSLFGGTLGGIAATIVSNPADVVVSELKKSKTSMSAWEAVDVLQKRAGLAAFAKGMDLRMIYYSLLVSLQFFLYDSIRIALGVGTDDVKLYLDVLNVALNERAKQ
ncbi:hypothetical protein ACHAXT_011855 [Thalassiosira profunda]